MDHSLLPNPATARLPATYESAKNALAECASLDECQSWADKAAALASYARQADDDELETLSRRIRGRAVRRAGELLRQIDPATGRNNQHAQVKRETGLPLHSRKEAATGAGMSEWQQKTALRVAAIPDKEFEKQIEQPKPPTVTKLAKQGTKPAPRPLIDLKGRDPRQFNTAMHFVGDVERYARELAAQDLERALPCLDANEKARVREAIAKIDAIHDRIVTRI